MQHALDPIFIINMIEILKISIIYSVISCQRHVRAMFDGAAELYSHYELQASIFFSSVFRCMSSAEN